jgi:hypothetical protein
VQRVAPYNRYMKSATDRHSRWTALDYHFLAATGLVLLFTAQRLTGYMTLFLYQRLPYDTLVELAHYFGGAGLIAVCTIGTGGEPMRLRSAPFVRVIVNGGWLVGSMLVLILWWMCTPAWRPSTLMWQLVAPGSALAAIGSLFRPVADAVSKWSHARAWKIATPLLLWQAYSIDWELRLNFLKDEITQQRPGVQWTHLGVDLIATASGLAWTLWVQRAHSVPAMTPVTQP